MKIIKKIQKNQRFFLAAALSLLLVSAFSPVALAMATPHTKLVSLDSYQLAVEGENPAPQIPPVDVNIGDQGSSFFSRDMIIIIVIGFAILIILLVFVAASSRK